MSQKPLFQPVIEQPPAVPVAAGPSTRSARSQSTQTQQGETAEQQTARETRHEKRMEIYFKLHTIFRDDNREWSRFCEIESKVRERIEKTVLRLKAAPLNPEKSV